MSPLPRESFANSHRRYGRLRCQLLSCSLGEVVDLSAGGMRVRSLGPPKFKEGATVGITLATVEPPLTFQCRIVWTRKVGWRVHELGLTFLDPTAPDRRALCDLAGGVTVQGEFPPNVFAGHPI